MPRPQRCRRVCSEPEYSCFDPEGVSNPDTVVLSVDEFQVIKLVDFEKQTHEECSSVMDISRTTVTEIYERARYKISDCIVNGKQLVIAGGNYRVCNGKSNQYCNKPCPKRFKGIIAKGRKNMRVAVSFNNGEVFQHFGHTEQFKIFDVENGAITKTEILDTNILGHDALVGFLKKNRIEVLICGGIGDKAQRTLYEVGIDLYCGVTGNADEVVISLINGSLIYNSNLKCSNHSHEGDYKKGGCQ